MSRLRLFIENFFAYGIISVLNKVIPFLLLPVITRLLPNTADFGRYDMYNMIINFASSLSILGMYDAMFREFFESSNDGYKKKVTSTALYIVFLSTCIIVLVLAIFDQFWANIFLNSKNTFIILMSAIGSFITALYSIVSAPTRMRNQRSIYIVSGVLQSLGYYGLSIFLIKIGFTYKALIYANLFTVLCVLMFFYFLNHEDFSLKYFDKKTAKILLRIGLPLVPTFISYWLLSSIDKVMLANMLGMSDVGIYSIGLKMASISQLVYMAFAGGWQYFAFSTMKDKDQIKLTSNVLEYLSAISIGMLILVMVIINKVFLILFTGDYLQGIIVFPYLFLSPLLLMLIHTVSNQLLVIRKTYYGILSLVLAILVNVKMNFVLIPIYGIKGAALSTLLGYAAALLSIIAIVWKIRLIYINKRLLVNAIIITVIVYGEFFYNNYINNIFWVSIFILLLYMYRRETIYLFTKCKSK